MACNNQRAVKLFAIVLKLFYQN